LDEALTTAGHPQPERREPDSAPRQTGIDPLDAFFAAAVGRVAADRHADLVERWNAAAGRFAQTAARPPGQRPQATLAELRDTLTELMQIGDEASGPAADEAAGPAADEAANLREAQMVMAVT